MLGNLEAISGDLPEYLQYSKVGNGKTYKEELVRREDLLKLLSDAAIQRQRALSTEIARNAEALSLRSTLSTMRMSQGEIRCHSDAVSPFWEVSRIHAADTSAE